MDAFASPAQLVPGKKYFTHKLGLDYIFSFFSVFVLLSAPRGPNLESLVDKNQTFTTVFVYFQDRAT